MNRLALRRFLKCLIAGVPLAAGCPGVYNPTYVAENKYVALPDGGVAEPMVAGQHLSEAECTALCQWTPVLPDMSSSSESTCLAVADLTRPHECRIVAVPDAGLEVFCQDYSAYQACNNARSGGGGGRCPEGLVGIPPIESRNVVGRHLARMAFFEAASVTSFRVLAGELRSLGAPPALVRAALGAARDEVRHARITTALARRFEAEPPSVTVRTPASRTTLAIALENAVEACVMETFAAVEVAYQGEHAAEPALRRSFARIAVDELRHAELAWEVDSFLGPLLCEGERAAVREARRRAAAQMVEWVGAPVDDLLIDVLGLPPPPMARALADRMRAALWS
jgi:hypothetical protein